MDVRLTRAGGCVMSSAACVLNKIVLVICNSAHYCTLRILTYSVHPFTGWWQVELSFKLASSVNRGCSTGTWNFIFLLFFVE